MKYLTWIAAFAIVAIVNNIFKELDIAYTLAVLICPDDITKMAQLGGLFSGIFAATTYGCAYYFARKINKRRETVKKQKNADAVGSMHIKDTEASPEAIEEPAQAIPAVPAEERTIEPKVVEVPQKQRYCKLCGGAIDNQSKKCTKCNKQYFRMTKCGIAICCLCFVILMLINVIVYQDMHYESEPWGLHNQIAELETENAKLQGKLYFYDEYIVFVSDDGTNEYHHLGCEDFDKSYFWAYNVDQADDKGYYPCPKCCE